MKIRDAAVLERRQAPLEIREISDEGEFAGYASVFDVEDSYGTIMTKGCFTRTLKEHRVAKTAPKLLYQHDSGLIVGEHTLLREDDKGLYIEGQLYYNEPAIPEAARAHTLMKKGQLEGISIGFTLYDGDSYEYSSDHDAFLIKELNLWENSLVTFPSNPEAQVNDVRAAFARGEVPAPSVIEKTLRKTLGMSEREAKRLVSGGYSELKGAHVDSQASRSEQLAELTRLASSVVSQNTTI